MVSRKQCGSGSSARATWRPLRARSPTRCATWRSRCSAISATSAGRAERRLERAGHGADAALDVGRRSGSSCGEQVGELIRVAQPLRVAPVRQVDVFLDARAVKGAVREAVQREDIEPLAREEVLELGERGRLGQFGARPGPTAAGRCRTRRRAAGDRVPRRRGDRNWRAPRPRTLPGGCCCSR